MKQAEKFGRPIITLIDVVGAYPGIEAEERGQGLMIAQCIEEMSFLKTPSFRLLQGRWFGGALALGGDRILMLENAWYSVISPEMCATILWRTRPGRRKRRNFLRLTPTDL